MRYLLLFAFTLMNIYSMQAQDMSAYSHEIFYHGGDTLRYRLLAPAGADMHKAYPLIIFLHGSGERGRDNAAQLLHGGALFLKDSIRREFPAYVLFPQCPDNEAWAPFRLKRDTSGKVTGADFPVDVPPTKPGALVKALLDSLLTTGKIDSKRVYLGGLSLGGIGTFNMLARYPDMFAAAFPICGAGNPETAANYAGKVPVWIFHGGDDKVVPVSFSRDFYAELKKLDAEVKYTEYPGVGHNSWDNAFAEPDLVPWLFRHHK
ncbi:carboxylesterase family protein [Chitinophaga japonensis]|uniref:Phospholipase/carboxylesterase n=1 Tax=Chitinophaga japonensis TaxID=104662 RepID=A0A562SLF4_CHIJA|nr:PHB depolymerase family esterase [Chitinophaga japonensis]TWI82052.1 phospholipase/carboxylesterase [Chitinophaga japonensis]